jgi:hypothetical protein
MNSEILTQNRQKIVYDLNRFITRVGKDWLQEYTTNNKSHINIIIRILEFKIFGFAYFLVKFSKENNKDTSGLGPFVLKLLQEEIERIESRALESSLFFLPHSSFRDEDYLMDRFLMYAKELHDFQEFSLAPNISYYLLIKSPMGDIPDIEFTTDFNDVQFLEFYEDSLMKFQEYENGNSPNFEHRSDVIKVASSKNEKLTFDSEGIGSFKFGMDLAQIEPKVLNWGQMRSINDSYRFNKAFDSEELGLSLYFEKERLVQIRVNLSSDVEPLERPIELGIDVPITSDDNYSTVLEKFGQPNKTEFERLFYGNFMIEYDYSTKWVKALFYSKSNWF